MSPAATLVSARRPFMLAAGALCVALATLAVVTVLARRTVERLQGGAEARQQGYDVLVALRRVRQDIGEMRVGVTGYVLTGDSLYLATYRSGLSGLAADTAVLRQLTATTPSLRAELDRLSPELEEYAADLAGTLRAVPPRPSARGGQAGLSRSAFLLEGIRPRFAAIETEQLRLVEDGSRAVQHAVSRANAVFTGVLIADVLLLLGTSVLLFAYLHARARAVARLARAEQDLQESRRLESLGQLAGGVAHDFNNVLTVITTLCELIAENLAADHPVQSDVALMSESANRGADLTRQLLAFGRRQILQPRVVDLNEVVRRFQVMFARVIPEDIEMSLHLAPDLGRVRADPGQLEQVLANLAANARDAMSEGGRLTIETANAELDSSAASLRQEVQPGSYVVLVVSDTGAGMDDDTRARVFEPFFTTKDVGKGTGLGLATVYGIVRQTGGHVWVYSEPAHGATFKVYLPRVNEEPIPEKPDSTAASRDTRGTEKILVVEDDRGVRELAVRVLAAAGYRVVAAAEPRTALELLFVDPAPPRLLITDVVLPGMSGPQLAREIRARLPDILVIYQSGYSEAAIASHGVLDGGAPLLHKPFTASALLQIVRGVLDGTHRAG